jgi:diguanylate cyclase (GGDEF)-like protein
VIASGVARSPLLALMACITAALSFRIGIGAGFLGGAAIIAAGLTLDPFVVHPLSIGFAFAVVALAAASVASGALFRRVMASGAGKPERWTDTPVRGMPAASAPRGSTAMDAADLESALEQNAISHFLREIREQVGGDEVVLWRYEPATDELVPIASASSAVPGVAFETNPPLESLVHWAVQQGIPTTNYDSEPSYFLTAAVGKDGRFQGALGVYAEHRDSISRDHAKAFLPRYATRMAMLLDMLSDGRETRRYRGKADKVVVAAQRIQRCQDLASLGDAICEAALDVSGGTRSTVIRWDGESNVGRVEGASSAHTIPRAFEIAADSFVGIACRERRRVLTISEWNDKSKVPPFGPGEPPRRIGSLAIVTLTLDELLLGAICVEGDEVSQLTSVEGDLLSMLAPVIAAALRNVAQLQDVTEKSNHDVLTGLANRRQFDERLRYHLANYTRNRQQVSLVLLDIDLFKNVNDVYGHDGGDVVLIEVANTVRNTIRDVDLCARYGGEELAILLPDADLQGAVRTAERLREEISKLRVAAPGGGAPISVTASFGVACYAESVRMGDALFPAADKALYQAKNAGRNCVRMAMQNGSLKES